MQEATSQTKELINKWVASLGQNHNKHITIKCGVDDQMASIIVHNRGVIETVERLSAYTVCQDVVETHNLNRTTFNQRKVYSDIEIQRGELVKDMAFHGMYMPQGDGFTLTLTGTLTTAEVDRVQKESDKQNNERKARWSQFIPAILTR